MSILDLVDRQPWMKSGSCAQTDPELFFLEKGGTVGRERRAKKVCHSCPVINECLSYALGEEFVYGIWGGTTEDERRRMASQKRVIGSDHQLCRDGGQPT